MELLLTLLFMLPCPMLFIGGIVGLVLYLSKSARNKRNAIWSAAAEKLGLQFTPAKGWLGQPMLQGRIQGVEVKMDILVRGSGKHRQVFTRARAAVPAGMPEGTIVGAQGVLDGIGKLFGAQDIELGVAKVDSKLLIKGRDERAVRDFLRTDQAQRAVLELVSSYREGRLRDEGVEVLRRGISNDLAVFQAMLNKVTDIHLRLSSEGAQALKQAEAEPPTPQRTGEALIAPPESPPPVQPLDTLNAPLQGPSGSDPEPTPAALDDDTDEDEGTTDEGLGAPADDGPADEGLGAPEHGSTPPDPGQLFQLLRRLADRSTRASEQRELEASIMGQPISLTLTVDRVRSTLGFRVPEHLQGGHTVIGQQEDLSFAVRFPSVRSAEIRDIEHGEVLEATGRIAGWERLYRQAVVNAD